MKQVRILNAEVEDDYRSMRGIESRGEMSGWECEEINDEIRDALEDEIPFIIDIEEAALNSGDNESREYEICEAIKKYLLDKHGMWTDFCEIVELQYEVID